MADRQQLIADQDSILDDCTTKARQQAFYMKKALENGNLREALKCSSGMLAELRTSLLSPKNYYNLYMQVFDELTAMQVHIVQESKKKKRKMADLYESVQHAQHILPRLYLLITVGSVYIQTKETPAKEILKDLLEMVKAVQNPIRGLFLRYYLLKTMKDKLPDEGTEFEGEGGDVSDAIDFVLQNLSEMNRLWIRLGHSGIKDKSKREAERNELRVTVGENIVRLASLEGVKLPLYKSKVLPGILDIIKGSKDPLSQQYLMDCVIQAFPDEFHLNTLDLILDTCTTLHNTVDIKMIFITFMERLAQYASTPENEISEVNKQVNIFKLFKKYIDKLIEESSTNIDAKKMLELEVAFLKFSIKSYPMNTEYVDEILSSCVNIIELQKSTMDNDTLKHLVKLLSIPLETLSLAIFTMGNYPSLMKHLHSGMRKTVAMRIVIAVLKSQRKLEKMELVEKLFDFIEPLMEKGEDEGEAYEFEEAQTQVAKLVHLVSFKDPELYWKILNYMKNKYVEGGEKKMKYTIPSLVYGALQLTRIVEKNGIAINIEEIFAFCLEVIEAISSHFPESALRLYLQCALAINNLKTVSSELENTGYDIMAEALTVYEDELSETDSRKQAIALIASTLERLTFFSSQNYDTLASNAAKYASKMLKRPDQFRCITHCLHLFYGTGSKDGERIGEIFKRLMKIWVLCKNKLENWELMVILLNKYIYFYLQKPELVKVGEVNKLISDIEGMMEKLSEKPELENITVYFNATKNAIFNKKSKDQLQDIQAQV
eukprot:TRINITY_DN767_c0_g1_i1.p1 TRINITY_DN767_c0_g1~~TRINITY_DN767_c0_g1_i1.p1  ORF type:complete len:774 (+),score=187.26 TRINITY_DN767_c0_g1_i1:160-2481(+)